MRTAILLGGLAIISALSLRQPNFELKALYDAHQWQDLYQHLQSTKGTPLYRGAVGVTFNQDPQSSERLLLSVIGDDPRSPEAQEAYEWLAHSYLYRGRYRSLVSIMDRQWAAFPSGGKSNEQTLIDSFRGLPDQTVESTRPSTLTHEAGSIFLPLSMDGQAATYFFDTGAWMSGMSASEAKRLGLKISNGWGTMGQSAGAQVSFRTAVVQDIVIGNTHFKSVSFAVFPDNQEPWSILPPGRRGIIGIPLLVGLQTLRWEKAATLELAKPSQPFRIQDANLTFNNDHLVIAATVQNDKISATVDTGAISTDLYEPFADKFASLLKQYGKSDTTEVRGIGRAERFDSVTLPQLKIRVGGADTVLSPAHVLLKSIGAKGCVGNFGMDLFQQTSAMEIDFGAMAFRLVGADRAH